MNRSIHTEIAIVGAGLVGLTAAIAFAKLGKSIVLLDAKPPFKMVDDVWDARIYALTENTINWLKSIGVWQHVNEARVNSIQSMQLWAPQSTMPLTLSAEDAYLAQMGCIIENQNLMQACWQALINTDVNIKTEAICVSIDNTSERAILQLSSGDVIQAKLLIAADGVNSWVRQQLNIGVQFKSFNQTAIVANFETALPHQDIARQWFSARETFALLPLVGKNVSLVWSLSTESATQMLTLAEETLAHKVQQRCQNALGELRLISKVLSFSLDQQTVNCVNDKRVLLMGDAAHQIHPMAGQGVNLGFRDIMAFEINASKLSVMHDIGDDGFLRQYQRTRKLDVLKMNSLTTGLDALFASSHAVSYQIAHWGMRALNHYPMLKKHLISQATL